MVLLEVQCGTVCGLFFLYEVGGVYEAIMREILLGFVGEEGVKIVWCRRQAAVEQIEVVVCATHFRRLTTPIRSMVQYPI